jgi:hypothetical protein
MSKHVSWIVAITLAIGAAGCATTPTVTSETVVVAGVGAVEVERLDVEVVRVDPATRMASIRQGQYGWRLKVPEIFGDLNAVRPGDRLQIRRVEGALLSARRAKKGARPEIVYTEEVSTPRFQNLPDRFVERSLTLTAKFERYDPATGMVDYVGPAGPRTHRVVDPDIANDLKRLRRGDMVDLTFAEAIHVMKI